MFEFIEKQRQKTDGQKKRFAFAVAFLFVTIIGVLWYFAVFPNFKSQNDIDKKIEKFENDPASSLSSVFGGKISEIKNQFGILKDYASAFNQKNTYYSSTSTESVSTTSQENVQ